MSTFSLLIYALIFYFSTNVLLLSINTEFNVNDFIIIPVFNAKKDAFFNFGSLIPLSTFFRDTILVNGFQESLAMICGIRSINQNSKILPKTTLTYQIRDYMFNIDSDASSAISYLVQNDIIIVLGTGTAYQSALNLQIFKNYDIGYIDFTAPNTLIRSPNYIRMNPSAADISLSVTRLLKAMNWTLVSVIYGDYLYGTRTNELFSQFAKEEGITIVCPRILPRTFIPLDEVLTQPIIRSITDCLTAISADFSVVVIFADSEAIHTILTEFWKIDSLRKLNFVFANSDYLPIFNLFSNSIISFPSSYILGIPLIMNFTS